MSRDDDDDEEGKFWVDSGPPDDEDEYEDPNPRASQTTNGPTPLLRLLPAIPQADPPIVVPVTTKPAAPTFKTTECERCKHIVLPFYRTCPQCEGVENLRKTEALAQVIRELKELSRNGDPSPQRERELVKQLEVFNHPNIKGLLQWCSDAREKPKSKPSGGGRGKKW